MQIAIFYHAYCINNWKDVVSDQVRTLMDSGLSDAADRIYVHVTKPESGFQDIWSFTNKVNIQENSNPDLYEKYALIDLQKYCMEHDTYIFYFHSKGITAEDKNAQNNIWTWRKYLEYFNITRWKECVERLKEYDCCGVQYQETPQKHFVGNFWWSKSSYIKTLPNIRHSRERFEQEYWICSNPNHKAHSFFFINKCLYNGIKEEEYVTT
jgi:hypothetical protein